MGLGFPMFRDVLDSNTNYVRNLNGRSILKHNSRAISKAFSHVLVLSNYEKPIIPSFLRHSSPTVLKCKFTARGTLSIAVKMSQKFEKFTFYLSETLSEILPELRQLVQPYQTSHLCLHLGPALK